MDKNLTPPPRLYVVVAWSIVLPLGCLFYQTLIYPNTLPQEGSEFGFLSIIPYFVAFVLFVASEILIRRITLTEKDFSKIYSKAEKLIMLNSFTSLLSFPASWMYRTWQVSLSIIMLSLAGVVFTWTNVMFRSRTSK